MWARIQNLRMKSGKTWAQLAMCLGVSTAAISHWKTGKAKPSLRIAYKIEQLEREFGLRPPEPPATFILAGSLAQRTRMMIRDSSAYAGDPLAEIRDIIARMKADLMRAEDLLSKIETKKPEVKP